MNGASKVGNADMAIRIIEACYETKLNDIPMASTDPNEVDCIDLVTQLRIMVGQNKDHSAMQLEIEAKFLKNAFKDYSVSEVYIATELFLSNRLDIQLPTHVTFSPMFISHLMNAYTRYKLQTMKDIEEKTQGDVLKLQQKDNIKRLEGMRACIKDCIQHSKEDFKERFFNGLVYDFLRKSNKLMLNDDIIKEGKKYAEKKFLSDRQKNHDKVKEKKEFKEPGDVLDMNPAGLYDRKKAESLYAKDYYLIQFFNSIENVEVFLSNILESEI